MALTIANRDPEKRIDVKGSRRTAQFKVTFDTSYPTGGYVVTPTTFGMQSIHSVNPAGCSSAGKLVHFDHTNSKIKLFTASGTELTNATDIHTETCDLQVTGT